MTVENTNVLEKKLSHISLTVNFLKMAIAIFRPFSKVDFCVIVQNEKARVGSSGILLTEKTNFSMNVLVTFIVSFLGFVRNNKKSARKLHG
jgi:hypothetical protein